MSVIQRIRDKAAWFVFGAIALSLIAFILQDAFTRKGGSSASNTTLGKVNGDIIDRNDFETKLAFYQEANGTPRDQLMGSLWDFMVENTVMNQAYKTLGIQFTSKELSDLLFGNTPPSWLQQAFTDPSTGMYNANAARDKFSQMKKNASDPSIAQLYTAYLEPTIEQGLRQKYQALITGAIYVPKFVAEKANADNNALAKISYVSIPYGIISDSTITISDDEIAAYENKHPKQFKQKEETRQISYINFGASASKDDSANIYNQMNLQKAEFAAATDNKKFIAKSASELPYYDSYISKSQIQQPVKDSLFTLPVGGIYGPYVDAGNYVIAKMVGVKQLPDSVKVRHILLSTHQPQQNGSLIRVRDDSAAYKRLDSAVALIKSGANFDSVCTAYSEDPGSKDKGGVYDYFTTGKMVEEFNDFAFGGTVGEKKIVKTSYGYHYIEILGQKGSEPAYKLAYLAKPIVASQETINAANSAATQFASANNDKAKFDAGAAKLNKQPVPAADIKANDNSIAAIGDNRQMVKWVFENSVGDVSAPFQVNESYYVAIITGVSKPGLMSAAYARPMVEPILKNEKKAKQIIASNIKGTTLDQIAAGAGRTVAMADSISFQSFIIPSIGNEPKILGAAFNKQILSKVSAPIAGNTGVFVIRGENVYAAPSLGSNPEMIRSSLESQLKSQAGYRSLSALKESADIEDFRSTFY